MSIEQPQYKNIQSYLIDEYPELSNFMREDLCIDSQLRIKRNLGGSTFIIPAQRTIDRLKALDDYDNAVDDLLMYILRDYIPDIASFMNKSHDIPNGHSRKTMGISLRNSDNIYIGGMKLEPVEFLMDRPRNIAIWKVVNGAEIRFIPDAPRATFEYTRK
jgi:hypothetical protein